MSSGGSAEGSQARTTGPTPGRERVKPLGARGERSAAAARARLEAYGASGEKVLEKALERGNLIKALSRVEENRGAAGVDGMKVEELRSYLKAHWPELRERLLAGAYEPQPVRRVEIPKADGGVRLLGMPTVLDRFIQQALLRLSRRSSILASRIRATGFGRGGGGTMPFGRLAATSGRGTSGWWTSTSRSSSTG